MIKPLMPGFLHGTPVRADRVAVGSAAGLRGLAPAGVSRALKSKHQAVGQAAARGQMRSNRPGCEHARKSHNAIWWP